MNALPRGLLWLRARKAEEELLKAAGPRPDHAKEARFANAKDAFMEEFRSDACHADVLEALGIKA